jgi:hypothetical protein
MEFEASRSFAYKFARYEILPELQKLPATQSEDKRGQARLFAQPPASTGIFSLSCLKMPVLSRLYPSRIKGVRIKGARVDYFFALRKHEPDPFNYAIKSGRVDCLPANASRKKCVPQPGQFN